MEKRTFRSENIVNEDVPFKSSYKKKRVTKSVPEPEQKPDQKSTLNESSNSINFNTSLSTSNVYSDESDKSEYTMDEYDRIVKKQKKRQNKSNQKRKFTPITDQNPIFTSLAKVDTYVRSSNQFGMKTINNNQVKCSLKGCDHSEQHKMTQMYLKCLCKQDNCTLCYSYRFCKYLNEWHIAKSGEHPSITVDITAAAQYSNIGIAIQIRKLIDHMIEMKNDLKPKEIKLNLEKKRRHHELLEQRNEAEKLKDSSFIPKKQANPEYLFPASLLPTLRQIQTYMNSIADYREGNRVKKLKELVEQRRLTKDLSDDEPFFTNIYFAEDHELIGSKNEHFNLMMTSKKLMSFLSKNGVGNTDGTSKITYHGYALVIYGITDIQGAFHPIAFMITNNETEADFRHFYFGLKNLAETFGYNFEPKFFMQDACQASFNAVTELFPDATVLMCYFYVKMHIKKYKNLLPEELYDEFMYDIDELHYSTSEDIYNERLEEFKEKWNEHEGMMNYMNTQWFTGDFRKWQIYLTDPGYTNMNSNMESFNSIFKNDYTEYLKCSIISTCKKIFECIAYYSNAANNANE